MSTLERSTTTILYELNDTEVHCFCAKCQGEKIIYYVSNSNSAACVGETLDFRSDTVTATQHTQHTMALVVHAFHLQRHIRHPTIYHTNT